MTPSEVLERHAALLVNLEHHGFSARLSWEDDVSITNSVKEGHTTLVASDICQTLEVAQRGYPDVGLFEKDLPFSNGFAWLERPFQFDAVPVQILSWLLMYRTQSDLRQHIALVPWSFHGGTRFFGFSDQVGAKVIRWPYGTPWSSLDPGDQPVARYFATLCAFMQQKILVTGTVSAERHARKRLEAQGFPHEPLIRVVELRRRESVLKHEPSNHGEEVEWSCQWIVRGHWRQQFYPSKHGTQPIWITPYVKGPEDKPLKAPRAEVFAVVR
jgi:hypothetical protein